MKNKKPFTEKELEEFIEMLDLYNNEVLDTVRILRSEMNEENFDKIKLLKPYFSRFTVLSEHFQKRLDLTMENLFQQINKFYEIITELQTGNIQSRSQLKTLHPIFLIAFDLDGSKY